MQANKPILFTTRKLMIRLTRTLASIIFVVLCITAYVYYEANIITITVHTEAHNKLAEQSTLTP